MDYTKFLQKKEHVVLAYLGGPQVYGKDRRLRIQGEQPAPGFHLFEVSGRHARAIEAVDPPDLSDLPKARGHLVVRGNDAWLASSSGIAPLLLLPADQPPPLSLTRARLWHSGDLVFESLDFDGEAEEAARERLERVAPLGDQKGVPATLRAAFGVSFAFAFARQIVIPVAMREVAHVAEQLAQGELVARPLLERLARERGEASERGRIRMFAAIAQRTGALPSAATAEERAEKALEGAGARMVSTRPLERGAMLEVIFRFGGERFVSVVNPVTLQVLDAGVCLAGEDSLVTLDSLPGVIREAIDTDRLVITRH